MEACNAPAEPWPRARLHILGGLDPQKHDSNEVGKGLMHRLDLSARLRRNLAIRARYDERPTLRRTRSLRADELIGF